MRGIRFKKFTWNWTSFIIGVHAGRNPVSGKRFLYIGLGPFLGMDFHWPEDTPKMKFYDTHDTHIHVSTRSGHGSR